MKTKVTRDNDDNKLKIRTRQEYQHRDNDNDDNNVPNNVIQATNAPLKDEGGCVRFLRIRKDKYNRLIIKAKDKMKKMREKE